MIIFLNGVSSSWKSVDLPFLAMPAKYLPGGEKAKEGIDFISKIDKEGNHVVEIKNGVYGKKLATLFQKLLSS